MMYFPESSIIPRVDHVEAFVHGKIGFLLHLQNAWDCFVATSMANQKFLAAMAFP